MSTGTSNELTHVSSPLLMTTGDASDGSVQDIGVLVGKSGGGSAVGTK